MKINKSLLLSIGKYYINRAKQTKVKWNKVADLEEIENCFKKTKFTTFQACAGTFWFSYKTKSGKIKGLKIDENSFPKWKIVT